jgi:hypothetical protein
MHCGEYVPYSDMVGDTRHNRAIDSLHRVWWHIVGRWLPHKCPACGERFKCKTDCDGIPF